MTGFTLSTVEIEAAIDRKAAERRQYHEVFLAYEIADLMQAVRADRQRELAALDAEGDEVLECPGCGAHTSVPARMRTEFINLHRMCRERAGR